MAKQRTFNPQRVGSNPIASTMPILEVDTYTKKILVFDGFESLHGFDEDVLYAVERYLDFWKISPEFTGKLIIEISYKPNEND